MASWIHVIFKCFMTTTSSSLFFNENNIWALESLLFGSKMYLNFRKTPMTFYGLKKRIIDVERGWWEPWNGPPGVLGHTKSSHTPTLHCLLWIPIAKVFWWFCGNSKVGASNLSTHPSIQPYKVNSGTSTSHNEYPGVNSVAFLNRTPTFWLVCGLVRIKKHVQKRLDDVFRFC